MCETLWGHNPAPTQGVKRWVVWHYLRHLSIWRGLNSP